MLRSSKFLPKISIGFLLLAAGLSLSCQRLANQYQRQILDCGDLAAHSQALYQIAHADAARAEVWDVDGATLSWHRLAVNNKGCFENTPSKTGHLVIKSADDASGAVIAKESFEGIRVVTLTNLKLSDQVPNVCPEKTVHVAKNSLLWSVQTPSREDQDFFFLVVPDDQAQRAQTSLLKSGASQVSLSLTGLLDGSNTITFALYDLLRSDRKLAEQSCEFIVDKQQPVITVKDSRNQLLGDSLRVFAPGEKLFVSTSEPANVQYCIMEAGKSGEPACSTLRSDSTLDLPRSGRWSLQFQVEDRSGNTEIRRYGVEVFDQNAVDLIQTRARLSMSGTNLDQANIALGLEAARQELEGAHERTAAEPDTRVAMLTAMLRTQEIARRAQTCKGSDKALQVGAVVLTYSSNGVLCAYSDRGAFLYTRQLETFGTRTPELFKIFQDRFIIYGFGKDRYRTQLRVLDAIEGTDKEIPIKDLTTYVHDFDVNPIDGTIYLLSRSGVRGQAAYWEIARDGQVRFQKDISGEKNYTYLSYLPLPEGPRIVLGYSTSVSSRVTLHPEFCTLTLTDCQGRTGRATPDFGDIFVNRKGNLLATNFQGKTLVWDLDDSSELLPEDAKESSGSFVQFLGEYDGFVTKNGNSYALDSLSRRDEKQIVFATLDPSLHFIDDELHNQTLLINERGFERWVNSVRTFGDSGAKDNVPIQDALVLRGVLNKSGTELTIFTSQYVATYQLAYANLNSYELFAGKQSGIMVSNTNGQLIYSNAQGRIQTFPSLMSSSTILMSPQRKYALLQTSTFEDRPFQIIDAAGEVAASFEGMAIQVAVADADAHDERVLYRLDNADFVLFDPASTSKVQSFLFKDFTYNDTVLLPKLPGQILVVEKGAITLVDAKSNQKKPIGSQASNVQTGKKFPFVSYLENENTVVLKNLVSGQELRWDNASIDTRNGIEEACHSIFVKREKDLILTVVDLRDFTTHDFAQGTPNCLRPAGQVVMETADTGANSFLLNTDYKILTSLPAKASWISANQQGILVRRDINGLEFFSYSFEGERLGQQTFKEKRSQVAFLGQNAISLGRYTLLAQTSYTSGANPNQTRYELYDSSFNPLASSVLYDKVQALTQWELMGPVLWNHDTNELHEIYHPETQDKLMDYLPVPQWDGIRFYPIDNAKLYEVLKAWIASRP